MKQTLFYSALIALFLITSLTLSQSYAALLMGEGDVNVDVKPGDSPVINQDWIIGAKDGDVSVSISASGVGSDLISFTKKSIDVGDGGAKFVEFTVTVPPDYKTDTKTMVLNPLLVATEVDTSGSSISVNTSVIKILTLNIDPNPDPRFQEPGYYPPDSQSLDQPVSLLKGLIPLE